LKREQEEHYPALDARGNRPATSPCGSPLLIDLETANALGPEIPPALLAVAEEVIE
jgi:hypothetical protein